MTSTGLLLALPVRQDIDRFLDILRETLRLDVYNRKMDVINRGFSGYNAPWSLVAFKKVRLRVHRFLCFPLNPTCILPPVLADARASDTPSASPTARYLVWRQ